MVVQCKKIILVINDQAKGTVVGSQRLERLIEDWISCFICTGGNRGLPRHLRRVNQGLEGRRWFDKMKATNARVEEMVRPQAWTSVHCLPGLEGRLLPMDQVWSAAAPYFSIFPERLCNGSCHFNWILLDDGCFERPIGQNPHELFVRLPSGGASAT